MPGRTAIRRTSRLEVSELQPHEPAADRCSCGGRRHERSLTRCQSHVLLVCAGYVTTYKAPNTLTFLTVKDSGHMVSGHHHRTSPRSFQCR